MKINLKTVLVLVVLAALAAGLLVSRCALKRRSEAYRKDGRAAIERVPATDTVRVGKLPAIRHVRPIVVAPIVAVEAKPDTALRRAMEKSTIIVSFEKRKPKRKGILRRPDGVDSLYIRTISPQGITAEAQYPWRWVDHGNFTVDSAGRLHLNPAESEKSQRQAIRKQKRQRTWRRIGTAAAVAGSLVLGIVLAR